MLFLILLKTEFIQFCKNLLNCTILFIESNQLLISGCRYITIYKVDQIKQMEEKHIMPSAIFVFLKYLFLVYVIFLGVLFGSKLFFNIEVVILIGYSLN